MNEDLKNIGSIRPTAPSAWITYLMGLVFGMALTVVGGSLISEKPAKTYAPCSMCHKVPVLDTAEKYKQWHRATPKQRVSLLVKWGRS